MNVHSLQTQKPKMVVAMWSLLILLVTCFVQDLHSSKINITLSPVKKDGTISRPVVPDLTKCGPITLPTGKKSVNCCPPPQNNKIIIEFELPPDNADVALRVRRPAHLADKEYIRKLSRAIQLMRELPDDDPRSLTQQANVHCAYCMGAYPQVGYQNKVFQVHESWLFFPFHRLYLYFFERICAKLIDEPTFAIPFWNWDSPNSMTIPPMYDRDTQSPLYDRFRDAKHLPPVPIDMNYNFTDLNKTVDKQVSINLSIMHRQMIARAKSSELFLGSPYRAGDEQNPGGGTIELFPHNTIHDWIGDRSQLNFKNMGSFHSTGRDPLFYAHHANVDRMWVLWKTLEGKNKHDYTEQDWLNAEFFFYDENAQLVRVRVADSLNTTKLGYVYQEVDNTPWINYKYSYNHTNTFSRNVKVHLVNDLVFPFRLDKVVSLVVPRTTKGEEEKENDLEEILVIEGIDVDRDVFVKFDVLINVENHDEVAEVGPDRVEFAGSFVNSPRVHRKKKHLRLGISDILEKLGAETDDFVLITLVPRSKFMPLTIDGIKIQIISDQVVFHTST